MFGKKKKFRLFSKSINFLLIEYVKILCLFFFFLEILYFLKAFFYFFMNFEVARVRNRFVWIGNGFVLELFFLFYIKIMFRRFLI